MEMPWSVGEVSCPFLTSSLAFQEAALERGKDPEPRRTGMGCSGAVCPAPCLHLHWLPVGSFMSLLGLP